MTEQDHAELARLRAQIFKCYKQEPTPFERINELCEEIEKLWGRIERESHSSH